ncbi:unnamed protein product, partial [Discosporangium mesarthrocarpum]
MGSADATPFRAVELDGNDGNLSFHGTAAPGRTESATDTLAVEMPAMKAESGEDDPGQGFSPPHPLRRRGAVSDLWQSQGGYRSNQNSMQKIFKEFKEGVAESRGLGKSEMKDIFTFTATGSKHLMAETPCEDRIVVHQMLVPKIDDDTRRDLEIDELDHAPFALFGVFDGHGGPACAEFLKNSVAEVMCHCPVLYDEDLQPFEKRACAILDTFSELENVHNKWAQSSMDTSGSTALLSTFQDGVLVMAGVGDSAGLFVDHEGKMHTLCPRHTTSNRREVERVIAMGGKIINGRVQGMLMPTRTLGDLDCKTMLGDIVSPHPELALLPIYAFPYGEDSCPGEEPFLVLASDGLWDVLSNQEVAHITRKGIRSLWKKQMKSAAKANKAAAEAAEGKPSSLFPDDSVTSARSSASSSTLSARPPRSNSWGV